jgi:hypothetical protein
MGTFPPFAPARKKDYNRVVGGSAVRVRVAKDVVFRDVSGEAVLLNLATGTYFGLNEVGTRIWNLLLEHESVDDVVSRLLTEFDVKEEVVRSDLETLIKDLRLKGLLDVHS